MTANHMSEAQAVNLVRNALLAAGVEMGKDGDHWPVIKATATSIMRDYENWCIEKNVFDEAKKHYKDMIMELQALSKNCTPESKPAINSAIAELLELYSACFTEVDVHNITITEEDDAPHIRRAEVIIKTLEDANG